MLLTQTNWMFGQAVTDFWVNLCIPLFFAPNPHSNSIKLLSCPSHTVLIEKIASILVEVLKVLVLQVHCHTKIFNHCLLNYLTKFLVLTIYFIQFMVYNNHSFIEFFCLQIWLTWLILYLYKTSSNNYYFNSNLEDLLKH